jgi:hypothetical protein
MPVSICKYIVVCVSVVICCAGVVGRKSEDGLECSGQGTCNCGVCECNTVR